MGARKTKAQTRADKIAQEYADELAELERQHQETQARLRAKKRALREAEKDALTVAQSELGVWAADTAGATSARDVVALHEAIKSGEMKAWLEQWTASEEGVSCDMEEVSGPDDESGTDADDDSALDSESEPINRSRYVAAY